MNNSFNNRLFQFVLTLFAVFYWLGAHADGSKDLYPDGASGYRAFLRAYTTPTNNWPFANQGVHYVYARPGEIITLASSAQNQNSGRIRLYSPSGTEVVNNDTDGRILNRTQETAGPQLVGGSVADRYTPIYYNVTQEGIYRVEFVSRSTSSDSAPTTVNANGSWSQPNSVFIAAWDVSVINTAGTGFVAGRVYTNVLNLNNGSNSPDSNGFYGVVHVLTKDGYIYRVNNNGNNGLYFTFFVNNKGVVDPVTQEATYKSYNSSNATNLATRVHNPNNQDVTANNHVTHKMFYTDPDPGMPTTASIDMTGGSTWLRTVPQTPTVTGVQLVGMDGTPSQVGNKGGYVRFNANVASSYSIVIESTGSPSFPTRTITGSAAAGLNEVYWDGKDGATTPMPLPAGSVPAKVIVQLQGAEVHFPYIDMEYNRLGTIIELTNGPDGPAAPDRYNVYWDDTTIPTGTAFVGSAPSPVNNSHLPPANSTGVNSTTNGHIWGVGGSGSTGNHFGNERTIDTWTFIRSQAVEFNTTLAVKEADLQIPSITPSTTTVLSGGPLTYTVTVFNDGPSDVTGAPFTFTVPAEFDPTGFTPTFNGNSCGTQATAVTYNPATRTFSSVLDLPDGCTVTYTFTGTVTAVPPGGNLLVEATILRPNDVTDPDATNQSDPNDPLTYVPPTDPYFECSDNGLGTPCNNILTNNVVAVASAPQADLRITKVRAGGATTYAPGSTVTYIVTVYNDGPDDVTGATVADLLPAGTNGTWTATFNNATGNASGTGHINNETVNIQSGGNIVYTVNVVVPSNYTGDLINTATVTPPPGIEDPDEDNNKSTVTNPPAPLANLSVVKDNGQTQYTPGTTVTYTITVANAGPSDASAVTVTDLLPAGITEATWTANYLGGAGAGGAATSGTANATHIINETVSIPNGGSIVYTVNVVVPSNFTGNLRNIARVDLPAPDPADPSIPTDPTPGDNEDFDEDTPAPVADLSVVKTDNAATYTPGSTVTYTVTVTNNGPSDVIGARVEDTFPGSLQGTWTVALNGGASGAAPNATGATGIDQLVNIPNGGSIVYTVNIAVPSDYIGHLVNTATIGVPPGVTDPNPGNNTSTDDNTPAPKADLSVVKTGPATYTAGQTVVYTVTVRNNGPSNVTGATVQDILPAGTTGTWTAVYGAGVSGGAYTTTPISGHINETVDIPNGAAIEYTVTVNVPSNHTGAVANTATVAVPPGTIDEVPGNNTSTSTNDPAPAADLVVVKTDGSATYSPGTTVVYTVTVTNNGPSDAVGYTVTDNLPAGTTGFWTAAFNGNATGALLGTGSISQTVNIANGASIVYTVHVVVPSNFTGQLINTATVTPPGTPGDPGYPTDPNPGNETSTDIDDPAPKADLSVVKTNNSATYTPGITVRYTVTVRNNGPSDVAGVAVVDNFPTGTTGTWTVVQNDGASGATSNATAATGISQTVNLPNGSSIVYTVDIDVPSDFTGQLINTATVTPPGTPGDPGYPEDPNPGDETSTDIDDPAPVADLGVAKTNGATTYTPGSTVTYTVTVTNNGPSDVVGAVITDNLPAGTTGTWTVTSSTDASAVAGTTGTGHINETVDIKDGGSIVYTVNVVVPSDYTGDLVNTARATVPPGTTDPDPDNDKSTDIDEPAPVANLSIEKDNNQTQYTPGTTVTYTITVANAGPADASGVRVTDLLPVGITEASWTASYIGGASGTASGAANATHIINQLVDLPNGSSVVYTVNVEVPSSFTGNLRNAARVDLPPPGPGIPTDPTPGDNEDFDEDPPASVADLSIVKTDNSATYTPGMPVIYTITVTNNGPSDVTGAVVEDTFPAGTIGTWTVTLNDGATGATPGAVAATGFSQTVNIPNGGSIVYEVTVDVPSGFTGNLTNTATVGVPPGTTDPNPGNNTSTDDNPPASKADLWITKNANDATYTPGTTATYTVRVGNNGPSDVTGATVQDILPAGTGNGTWEVTAVSDPADVSVAVGTTGSGHVNQQVDIDNGGWIEYTVNVEVPSDYTGELVNTATVTPPPGLEDPQLDNNMSTTGNPPNAVADLSLVKVSESDTYTPGETVIYTITVTNNGPSDVIGATVTDNLPTGTTGHWTASMNGGATGALSGAGDISQTVNMPGGSSIVYTVTVNVPSGFTGNLTNAAGVGVPPGVTDPNPGNNNDDDTDGPAPKADLSVVKTDNAANFTPGTAVVYTVTVTNNGPSDVTGATVTDVLPAGTTGGWEVTASTNASATVGTNGMGNLSQTVNIQNGGSIVYTVTVDVPSDFAGNLVNTARADVPPGTTDPDPDNNTSTDENEPALVADLALTKAVSNANPKVGDIVIFTLTVTNNGPSDAPDVVVTDHLPSGYTFVSASSADYSAATGLWTVGTLANGANAQLTIQARVRGAGDYRNIATASSPAHDPNPGDNTDNAKGSVIQANNDHLGSVNGHEGGTTFGSVLDNDLLNGAGITRNAAGEPVEVELHVGTVTTPPASGTITMNPDGTITVDPGTTEGTYEIPYEICEVGNPTNCDQAVATIVVTKAIIDPDDDFYDNVDGITGATVGNVLDNDKLNGVQVDPADVTITVLEPATSVPDAVNANVPVLHADGTITIDPNTPAGEYRIRYQICENINPTTNCDWAIARVNVVMPQIDAVNDNMGPINGVTGGSAGNVLDNDTFNGNPATTSNVAITEVNPAIPVIDAPSGNTTVPTLDPATGEVTVPPGTPAGDYRIDYRICDVINPKNCDDATVTVRVFKPEIKAEDDNYITPDVVPCGIGRAGSDNIGNVLSNDRFNGVTGAGILALADISVVQAAVANHDAVNANVPVLNTATGVVSIPANTPAGTYQIRYRITDKLMPTNYSEATVTVRICKAEIDAVDDKGIPTVTRPDYVSINGYEGGAVPSVITNDLLNGTALTTANIGTGVDQVTLTPDMDGPYPGKLTFNADGTITVAPQTEAGEYRWWYTVCENLNPHNCDRAVATIVVHAAPIDAVDDNFPITIGRTGSTTPSVLDNDLLNNDPIIRDEIILTPGTPSHPGLTMNEDGTINVPAGTKEGTYTYPYTICEVLNPSNCDDAVATIVVTAPDLEIPNTFTPNGDGKNDAFEIVGWEAYDRIELVVFNRWGNEVYRNVDYANNWTGIGLNDGTYYYMVKLIKGNTTDIRKGWVLIKRR